MADIKVQKIEGVTSSSVQLSNRKLYATLCYYYPQYKLQDAADMPARDLSLLVRTARQIHANNMADMVAIIAAPHGKNKDSVEKIMKHFQNLAKD
jgi:hypothetical protein